MKPKRALIFGAKGQDGAYLRRLLEMDGYQVIALSRSEHGSDGDISLRASVERQIHNYRPEQIYHLAANSTTRHEAAFDNHAAICTGTLNLLEAVRVLSPDSKVFLCGSSIQFENRGEPIHESCAFIFDNYYAVARTHAVHTARYYRSLGVGAYVGYLFHHDSPERRERHLSQKIVRAAARIYKGSQERLVLGSLGTVKEWGYAGDIMAGAKHLLSQDEVYEAVIGTGEGYAVRDWVSQCFQFFDLDWQEHVDLIPGFTPEYKYMVSDPSTMRLLGWRHQTAFRALSKLMCERALTATSVIS
jgi:GDPmannose 4,6-dehydratase